MWDLKQLKHFKAIYEYGSLLGASKEIGVGQSALTKSLKKLEEALDLQLFARHTRELIPTEAGHLLFQKALRVIAESEEFQKSAETLATGEAGSVSIGCGPLPADLLVVPLIHKLVAADSRIELNVGVDEFEKLIYGLVTYEHDLLLYDIGELKTVPEPDRFEVIGLIQTPIVFVVSPSHPILKGGKPTLEKLATAHWALPKIPQRFIEQIPSTYGELLLSSMQTRYQIENPQTCVNLAKAGLVVTATAKLLVEQDLAEGDLVAIPLPFKVTTDVALYRLRSRIMTSSVKFVMQQLSKLS